MFDGTSRLHFFGSPKAVVDTFVEWSGATDGELIVVFSEAALSKDDFRAVGVGPTSFLERSHVPTYPPTPRRPIWGSGLAVLASAST